MLSEGWVSPIQPASSATLADRRLRDIGHHSECVAKQMLRACQFLLHRPADTNETGKREVP
jgi:hypothetical protein